MPAEDDAGVRFIRTAQALDHIAGDLAGEKPSGMGYDASYDLLHPIRAGQAVLGKSFNCSPALKFIPRIPSACEISLPRLHDFTPLMWLWMVVF